MRGVLGAAALAGAALFVGNATEARADEPIEMCCDKWNGSAVKLSNGNWEARVQKGLQKDTLEGVGEYATEQEAKDEAKKVADNRNGKNHG